MKTISVYLVLFFSFFIVQLNAQDENYQKKIKALENLKEDIVEKEKRELKKEIEFINEQLNHGDISTEKAQKLKKSAANKHALNIENSIAIVENKISLLKRNKEEYFVLTDEMSEQDDGTFNITINGEEVLLFKSNELKRKVQYDRRTYVDPVVAIGFNNTIIEGQSLEDSPYQLVGSRFLELGWAWRTRVFKNSNIVRLNYGVSFQLNGLKAKNNEYFVVENGNTELQEFEFDLRKSKFRMDNLVFPIHFEFGPSKFTETEDKIRYSIHNQFRFGFGGFGGFNIGARQKLKYTLEGRNIKEKLKGGYNASTFVYGLSAYAGFDGIQLYAKYDLSPVFKDAIVKQRNISLGVRFDLD